MPADRGTPGSAIHRPNLADHPVSKSEGIGSRLSGRAGMDLRETLVAIRAAINSSFRSGMSRKAVERLVSRPHQRVSGKEEAVSCAGLLIRDGR
ncbi:hypothetical protein GCM10010172_36690 [Paractinoplanes ferrugineus]|uniref:Uncharacterized protein n=1 Tax=Paractinoplanes ferrugineus TaxID=113564 RepID=A0A919IUG6_9ACTN|nr:hypothetical protein Afe05nite_11060 [Actinoplanes ferrugineus]